MNYKLLIFIILIYFNSNIYSQTYYNDSSFVYIKGGNFYSEKKKKEKVYGFYISKYEVTNLEYCKFLNKKKLSKDTLNKYIYLQKKECKIYLQDSIFKVENGFENHPVVFVSWSGANAFCKFYNLRLPSETEWEYVAVKSKYFFFKNLFRKYKTYSGSNNAEYIAWFKNNSENKVHNVGLKKPNKNGIYDMSGNVDEWCNNWYSADFKNTTKKGVYKVIKGGSWYNSEKMLQIFNTRATNPKSQKATIGFRVVKDIATFCKKK